MVLVAATALGLLAACWLLWQRCCNQWTETKVDQEKPKAPSPKVKTIQSDKQDISKVPSSVHEPAGDDRKKHKIQQEIKSNDDILSESDDVVPEEENIVDDSYETEEQDFSGHQLTESIHEVANDDEAILDEDDLLFDDRRAKDGESTEEKDESPSDQIQPLKEIELPVETWQLILNPVLQTHEDFCNMRQINRFFRDHVAPTLKHGYTLSLYVQKDFKDEGFKSIIATPELARLVETIQFIFVEKIMDQRLMIDILSNLESHAKYLTRFKKLKFIGKECHIARRDIRDFISNGRLAIFPSLSEIDQHQTFDPAQFQRIILEQVPNLKTLSSVSIGAPDTQNPQGVLQPGTVGNSLSVLIHALNTQPHFKKNLRRLVLYQPNVLEDYHGQSLSRLEILSAYLASNANLASRIEELEVQGALGQNAILHMTEIIDRLPNLILLGLPGFSKALVKSVMRRNYACAHLQTLKITIGHDQHCSMGQLKLFAARLQFLKTLHIKLEDDEQATRRNVKNMVTTGLPHLGTNSHLCLEKTKEFYFNGELFNLKQINSFACLSWIDMDFGDFTSILSGRHPLQNIKDVSFGEIKRINFFLRRRLKLPENKVVLDFLETFHKVQTQCSYLYD